MKISVVTISYNQREFLSACIDSVASQEGPWEHIVVDPGSTDGSRDLIEERRSHFSDVLLDPDRGPADGLNKGFARASGDVFYYLNSDDVVLPGAFAAARRFLAARPDVDVVSGHGVIIDESGRQMRKVFSDPISRHRLAYGGGILIQPATFIRRAAFERAGGFNIENRSNWDGELVVDLFLSGAKFAVCNEVWAGYRIHGESITATGKLNEKIRAWGRRRYQKVMGSEIGSSAEIYRLLYQVERAVRHPEALLARLRNVRVYGARR